MHAEYLFAMPAEASSRLQTSSTNAPHGSLATSCKSNEFPQKQDVSCSSAWVVPKHLSAHQTELATSRNSKVEMEVDSLDRNPPSRPTLSAYAFGLLFYKQFLVFFLFLSYFGTDDYEKTRDNNNVCV